MCSRGPKCNKGIAISCIVYNVLIFVSGILFTSDTIKVNDYPPTSKPIVKIPNGVYSALYTIKGAVGIACGVLLLMGIKNKNKLYVKIFFYYGIAMIVFYCISAVIVILGGRAWNAVFDVFCVFVVAYLNFYHIKPYRDQLMGSP